MSGKLRQQVIVTGLGGQGVLLATRILAECAAAMGLDVITSETHGMAQRGGSVISMVKAGPFRSPLIAEGEADLGIFLDAATVDVHRHYLKTGAPAFVNGRHPERPGWVDAESAAREAGAPRSANLALLGYAASTGSLFCGPEILEQVVGRILSGRGRIPALAALRSGAALENR
jgi:indolepyruvate ferredoxin oxidoreductase beta subunit